MFSILIPHWILLFSVRLIGVLLLYFKCSVSLFLLYFINSYSVRFWMIGFYCLYPPCLTHTKKEKLFLQFLFNVFIEYLGSEVDFFPPLHIIFKHYYSVYINLRFKIEIFFTRKLFYTLKSVMYNIFVF